MRKIVINEKQLDKFKKLLLKEYYNVGQVNLSTKNGKDFTIVYIDPKTSTDDIYANKDMLKSYGMEFLPYNRYIKYVKGVPYAWGWVIWKGQEDKIYPLINKFAEEIGAKETPPEDGQQRTVEEVLAALDDIRPLIMKATAQVPNVDGQGVINQAEELKKRLAQGIGSEETMEALQSLIQFRIEMRKHMGHKLSFLNTLLVWFQNPKATDVRSKGEWTKMGYSLKPDAKPIILSMPAKFRNFFGEKYDEIVRQFLEQEGVKNIKELTPSQKIRLERATKYPDIRAGFKPYIAYDISDMVKGPNAEEFPENNFEWYDAKSEATSKEDKLINAVVEFGTSLGIKYEYKPLQDLQGARGYATSTGSIAIADDKRNQGLLSTAIHETAHQIMHWEVVKTKNKRLEKFYFGGSSKRGTQIVEQEAELCAWIVLQSFGYNKQQTAFNYLANWGMNKENCNNVFDQVYKVAEFVYDGILKYANENNDNMENGGK